MDVINAISWEIWSRMTNLAEGVVHSLELGGMLGSRPPPSKDVFTMDSPSPCCGRPEIDLVCSKTAGASVKYHPNRPLAVDTIRVGR